MSGFDNTSETIRTIAVTPDTATANDYVIYVTAAANFTLNLPAVATLPPGRTYRVVKDAAAFTVTIDGAASELINGATTLVLASGAFHGATLVNTGTAWIAESVY